MTEFIQWVLQGWHQGVLSRGWLGPMSSYSRYCRGDIKGSCPEGDWVPWVHTVGTAEVTSSGLVQRVTGFHEFMQLQRWHQGVLLGGWLGSMASCSGCCRGDIKGSYPEGDRVPWVHTVGAAGVKSRGLVQRVTGSHEFIQSVLQGWHQVVLFRGWLGPMSSCNCRDDIKGVLLGGWLGSMTSCSGCCMGEIKGSCLEGDWVPWLQSVGAAGITSCL